MPRGRTFYIFYIREGRNGGKAKNERLGRERGEKEGKKGERRGKEEENGGDSQVWLPKKGEKEPRMLETTMDV